MPRPHFGQFDHISVFCYPAYNFSSNPLPNFGMRKRTWSFRTALNVLTLMCSELLLYNVPQPEKPWLYGEVRSMLHARHTAFLSLKTTKDPGTTCVNLELDLEIREAKKQYTLLRRATTHHLRLSTNMARTTAHHQLPTDEHGSHNQPLFATL